MKKYKNITILTVLILIFFVITNNNIKEKGPFKTNYILEEIINVNDKSDFESSINKPIEEDFKSRIDSILEKSINRKEILIVDSPETYIWNLNTTDFVKGLMYETSIVLNFMSKNNKDKEKLREFNREFQQNYTCFSIIVGNSGNHFKTIYELTLDTPEKKENFLESYNFLSYQIVPFKMTEEYLELCRVEKLKANEYYEKFKNPIL